MTDLQDRGLMIETETEWAFRTPHGNVATFSLRPGSSDWNTANSCNGTNDEYHLPSGLTGWALDVGAHIGALTVPLLLDNPDLRVVAIEALPENAALLRENIRRNRVADRCVVLERAAGDGKPQRIGYGFATGPEAHSRYIGSANAPKDRDFVTVPGVSLDQVFDVAFPVDGPLEKIEFVWLKIDAEGAEYPFFESASIDDLRLIKHMEGEVHFGIQRLREALPTHEVTGDKDFGQFTAVRRA